MISKVVFAAGLTLIVAGLFMMAVMSFDVQLVGMILILFGFTLVGFCQAAGHRR